MRARVQLRTLEGLDPNHVLFLKGVLSRRAKAHIALKDYTSALQACQRVRAGRACVRACVCLRVPPSSPP